MSGPRLAWAETLSPFKLLNEALENAINSFEADLFQKKILMPADLDAHLCKATYLGSHLPFTRGSKSESNMLADKLASLAAAISDQYLQ